MTEKPALSVVQALAAVMDDVRAVRKGDRNSQQNYVFRGIDAVMNAVGPSLRKHGVVVVPVLEEANYRDVQTSTGKPSRECTVKVRYRFHGPAGDVIECVTPGESMDFGDKGAPKAMSVAFRTALLQALCLPTDEADPDSQSYERAPRGEGSQEPSAADRAREVLRNVATTKDLNLPAVARAYEAGRGVRLQDEQDFSFIERFTEKVRADEITFDGPRAVA